MNESVASPEQLHTSPSNAPSSNDSRKARKPPNITPRRFNRFFTPRSSASAHQSPARSSRSYRQLRDITRDAVNGARASSSSQRALFEDIQSIAVTKCSAPRYESKKRKRLSPSIPDSSPPRSSPCDQPSGGISYISYASDDECSLPRRISNVGTISRNLQRSFGGRDCIGRGSRQEHGAG